MGRILAALALGTAALGATFAMPARAQAPYDITVILPLTGNAAFLGTGGQKTLARLQDIVNQQGGIQGRPLHFTFEDDQTSPQNAVQLAGAAIAQHPAVMMGSALVAMCNAMLPMLKNGPFDYCLSPAAHPAPGSWMFSTNVSTTDLIEASVRYARERGWTNVATISSSDATGQDFETSLETVLKMPENVGIKIVTRERFNQSDVSVTAQMERIRAASPQMVMTWTTGSAVAILFKGAVQAGLDMPILTSNGNQTFAQMDQYADFLPKQLYIPSSLFDPHEGALYDPRIEAAQKIFYDAMNAQKLPIDIIAAHVWDPGMMIVEALRKLGPAATGAQVKDYLDGQTNWAGVNGIYDFKKVPQRGLDVQSAVMTRWDAGKHAWVVVSKAGGSPL